MNDAAFRTARGAQGEVLHLIPYGPAALPPVSRRHLEQAFEAARDTALSVGRVRRHGFRFAGAAPLDLLPADRDAASWAEAVETVAGLSTAYGVSLCLRLLALVAVMAKAEWSRPWFRLERAGATIHPALLQAAALAPLTPTGGFAETSLRALLPAR